MPSKWDFIRGDPNVKELIAKELTYAYILGLEAGHSMSEQEYMSLLNNQEIFIDKMFRNYLSELNSPKADYYGVIA